MIKKSRKIGFVCLIILFFVIISRFKIVDIGGNKLFIFAGPNETGYLLNQKTIKTEIGTIHLERFGKVYPKGMLGFGIKYFLWYELSVEGEDIKYDLKLFGEKIKNVNVILLDNRNYFSIFISPQYFEVFNTINGIEGRAINNIFFDPKKRSLIFSRDVYQSSFYIEMTLDGNILESEFY
jgi:hypothetical protein